jgi:hypothetical protein
MNFNTIKMKRILILIGFLATLTFACLAEDIIVTKDAIEIDIEETTVIADKFECKDFDSQRTMQPKQYRNEGERFRKEAPLLLYQQYKNGRLMIVFGLTQTITGGVALATGGLIAVFSSMFQYGILTESVVLFAVGGACLGTGVPLLVLGGAKKRNAFNTFRKEYPAKQTISNFQLNLHGNGLGFAYAFLMYEYNV